MIVTRKLVPSVYYNKSRDFQLIGRTFDAVCNNIKCNIDYIRSLPLGDDVDNRIIDLVCYTLGFKQIHSYNLRQLRGLCSIFNYALRNKGNRQSIEAVVNMLLNIEGIKDLGTVVIDNNVCYIYIPLQLKNVTIIYDILDYILPAGMGCRIIRQKLVDTGAITESRSSVSINDTDVVVKTFVNSQVPPYQDDVIPSDLGIRNDNASVLGYDEDATIVEE